MASIIVNSALDNTIAGDGLTTLREAVIQANSGASEDMIFFDASLDNQTLTLTQGDLDITQGTVTIHGDIEGDGQLDITLSGGGGPGGFGFFNITGAATAVVIDSLNMINGYVAPPPVAYGAAAYAISNAGTLTISNSQIADTTVFGVAGEQIPLVGGFDSAGGNAAVISSSGTLNIVDTIIRNITVSAGAGSPGLDGASAVDYGADGFNGRAGGHGAVIISTGILNLQNTLFNDVTVTAGAGGQGGNGVSYFDPISMVTENGRGGNGGRGGDADLIRNAGTVGGEFGLGVGNFGSGGGGGFGTGINGSPNGLFGSPGSVSAGIGNIGGGTSAGVDNHSLGNLFVLSTGVDASPGTVGNPFADVMWGMNSNDILNGLAGNDDIAGGAGNDQLNGGDQDDTIEGGTGNDIMEGGSNTAAGDTISFAGFRAAPGTTQGITVDLGFSAQQDTGVGLDTITGFENAIGSDFNDTIVGSSGINIIRGGRGNDTLFVSASHADVAGEIFDGGAGDDTLTFEGSSGTSNLRNDAVLSIQSLRLNDTNAGGSLTIQLNANQFSATGIALNAVMSLDGYGDNTETFDIAMGTAASLNISGLTFTGITSATRFLITGDSSIENITGTSISDTINAGAGVDIVNSGAGNDTVNGGAGGDTLNGGANLAGGDTLTYQTSAAGVTVNLFTNINTGGDAAGDTLSGFENVTGSALGDNITGNAGANILNGGVDAVSDTLAGGLGNDTYIINTSSDLITEFVAGGTADVVQASVSFTLANDDFIETMQTTNAALTTAINLTGNAIRQVITGNAGANILNGGIDAVSDTLAGGLGNDTYIINTSSDLITEFSNGGLADVVKASVSFALANDDYIDIMQTTDAALLTAINLTGNGIRQVITGNAGANILNGGVDVVSDTLAGGLGNDTYIINTSTDLITEFVGGGAADVVQASVSFTLANDDFIETLQTTNAALLTAINLTGNAVAQSITGNAGANILNGMFGNDILTGGTGADSFLFNSTLSAASNRDTITDFNVVADIIQLENTGIFTALGAALGVLNVAMFKNLTTGGPLDATDRILYDDVTGSLSYDADGNGIIAAIQFATLTGSPTITNADFFVV